MVEPECMILQLMISKCAFFGVGGFLIRLYQILVFYELIHITFCLYRFRDFPVLFPCTLIWCHLLLVVPKYQMVPFSVWYNLTNKLLVKLDSFGSFVNTHLKKLWWIISHCSFILQLTNNCFILVLIHCGTFSCLFCSFSLYFANTLILRWNCW